MLSHRIAGVHPALLNRTDQTQREEEYAPALLGGHHYHILENLNLSRLACESEPEMACSVLIPTLRKSKYTYLL